jgi:hypothetical protein
MTQKSFLTRGWNNTISVVQGLPTFLFVAYGLATPLGGTREGMIALSVVGAFF